MERLYISFKNSSLELSNRWNIIIRSIHAILWIAVAVSAIIIIDASPYNVHTNSVDLNGNGVTCSVLTTEKLDIGTTMVLLSTGTLILWGNIFVWILFMYKLYTLLKYVRDADGDIMDTEFSTLMK